MNATISALPGANDIVLKGGRVIDPATGTDAILDVAVYRRQDCRGWCRPAVPAGADPARCVRGRSSRPA